jgi:hypothetical protein
MLNTTSITIIKPRRRTTDFDGSKPVDKTMRFYAPIQLSDKMSETKEGFLICHDVPIARLGEMLYKDGEIDDVQGKNGIIRITRDADELFSQQAMASFEGKPLCEDHPVEDVTPETWSTVSKGHMQNVRRGESDLSDFLLADILVMDKDAISAIRSGGKREVSLGYDADYEQIEPGVGRQKNIIGNHVAYLKRGRCGPRCAIRDRRPSMPKLSIKDALLRAFKAKDAAEVEELAKEVGEGSGEGATHVHVHMGGKEPATTDEKPAGGEAAATEAAAKYGAEGGKEKTIDERMKDMEECLKKLMDAKSGETTTDEVPGEKLVEEEETTAAEAGKRTTDSASVYTDFAARAEVIAPGVKMPRLTKDAAMDAKKTADGICICKRKALDAGMKIDRSKAVIGKFLNTRDGATIDKLTCDRVDAVFIGASELLKAENNGKSGASTKTADEQKVNAFAKGGQEQINREFWENQGKK